MITLALGDSPNLPQAPIQQAPQQGGLPPPQPLGRPSITPQAPPSLPTPAPDPEAMAIPGAVDTTPQTPPVGPPPVGGLNHVLADRFGRLQKAVEAHGGMLYIYSGARDHRQQAQLYKDAVGKYGSDQEARKHVAVPGKSHHDPHAGVALGIGDGAIGVDLRGDLAIAHKLAPHFGLQFDKKTPWHMSLAGIK